MLAATAPAAGQETASRAEFTVDGLEEAEFADTAVDRLETDLPHVTLSWSVPAGAEDDGREEEAYVFTLQQAESPEFYNPRTLYEGRDTSSFRGGLAEGDVFYRIRAAGAGGENGEWSRPLHVRVEYQSMERAVALFAVGGLVVLGTVVLVVAGARKDREEARKEESAS